MIMTLTRCANWIRGSVKNNKSYLVKSAYSTRNMTNDNHGQNIVWIDMELTGLEIENCHILEIACLITNEKLKSITDELNIVIHQSNEILDNMNEWCKIHHKQSGLIQETCTSKIHLEDAENILLNHLKKFVPEKSCPMAGNSVYMDRMFLKKYMPTVDNYLHYRIIDVSTIKELARRWNPDLHKSAPSKNLHHRALPDIKESIQELAYYKDHMFVQ